MVKKITKAVTTHSLFLQIPPAAYKKKGSRLATLDFSFIASTAFCLHARFYGFIFHVNLL
jgi:hypothetical protein